MQITRAADYAVRAMIHLATLPEGTTVPVVELARAGDAPEKFVSKVLQQLVRARMLRSARGKGGGFQLAVQPSRVTLLDVVEVVEGPLEINVCLQEAESCNRRGWCGAYPVWREAQAALKAVLRGATIAQLARDTASRLSGPDSSREGLSVIPRLKKERKPKRRLNVWK